MKTRDLYGLRCMELWFCMETMVLYENHDFVWKLEY